MRFLLPLIILAGVIYLVVKLVSPARHRQFRTPDRQTRIADLEYQLKRAEHDLMTYNLRGKGLCPHCECEVAASAIKCENCEERFWMTQDEANRSIDAGRARIEEIQRVLATIR